MKKIYVLSVLMALFLGVAQGQLFMPKEMRQAYENKTRSEEGRPGENYFQNSADYTINVDFNPQTGWINGKMDIVYHNNSQDTLKQLVLRKYMDFFKEGISRNFSVGGQDLHQGVKIFDVEINGESIPMPKESRWFSTNEFIRTTILPFSETKISLCWEFVMPLDITVRYGKYAEESWFVAYWYPQIAVYDDVSGWDTHPYTGSAEFYNDFNNYDVTIHLPENYMVWATGLLQNEKKHFSKEILKKLALSRQSDSVVHIIDQESYTTGDFLKEYTSWRYVAHSAPDFAFAVSDSYLWDATSVEVEPGRRVWVDAVYKKDSKDFHTVAELSAKIIDLFSNEVIGEPYPYPQMTAFNGGGGMEFPMMVNDGDSRSYEGTVHLTAHEIGHSYFPFHVMTNESYYAFMDEGLVSFIPRLAEAYFLDDFDPLAGIIGSYGKNSSTMFQAPLMVSSYMINDYSAYRVHAYTRPANAFNTLREMLGEQLFKDAMFEYIQRWKKKHPTPYDFFNTIEDYTDMELDWFWKPWFFEFGYPDLAIDFDEEKNAAIITNKGYLPVSIHLEVTDDNGEVHRIHQGAEVWKSGTKKIEIRLDSKVRKLELDATAFPDAFPEDNILVR